MTVPHDISPSLPLFAGLAAGDVERARGLFTMLDVRAGRVLGRQGSPGREFVVVVAGQVAVSIDDEPIAVLGSGHHFGALPLLAPMGHPRRLASTQAMEASRIAVADRREFATLVADIPAVGDRIRTLAAERLAYFEARRTARATPSAASAYPVDALTPAA